MRVKALFPNEKPLRVDVVLEPYASLGARKRNGN